jgi:hypothetical protein
MARLTIQFTPQGAEQFIRVALVSDEDATPTEHEQQHRRLVAALFPGLDLGGDPPGIEVERERPAREPMLGCSGDDGGYEVIDLG